ncbi:FAD-dependent oxidoreductase [Candidatus Berkiella aquae]|uniref:D-amino-acid oxidase n=1 Tax=Candidatus Berkiella aquae TaxID=295108 RepID=A0A0Q9YN26_9GAMM|nr:FAD-dependent oxidoreductase [Candidatus Berkiella aquae]MCS5712606.1 FAD-dependent oxidoreductase [Candidatus Berkiella aquae]
MKIAIVGAGIVGRLMAWHLCQYHQIHLFDSAKTQERETCSMAAGAMISPYTEISVLGKEWLDKALAALDWWPRILSSLPASVYYQCSGTKVLANKEHQSLLEHFVMNIRHQLPHVRFEPIEPIDQQVGCIFSSEAHLNPRQVMKGIALYLHQYGVHWHEARVEAINPYVITVHNQEKSFDCVIDCRGIGAKQQVEALRGVRGEMILCEAPQIHLTHSIRYLHPIYSCYIVPQGNHQYMIGATQMESESLQSIYAKSVMQLLTGATLVDPRFKDAHIIGTNVGLRPATPLQVPFVLDRPGLKSLNGFFRHGFLLAPAVVAEVAKQLH